MFIVTAIPTIIIAFKKKCWFYCLIKKAYVSKIHFHRIKWVYRSFRLYLYLYVYNKHLCSIKLKVYVAFSYYPSHLLLFLSFNHNRS